MKKLVISVLLVVLFIVSSGVVKAEEKKSQPRKKPRPSKVRKTEGTFYPDPRTPEQRDRHSRGDRSERVKDQLQRFDKGIRRRQGEHKKFIDSLVSIKNQAIKEKAKKTAEMIGKLIEAKNAEFAASARKIEEGRSRYREMLVPPGKKPAEKQKPAKPATAKPEKEKKEEVKTEEVKKEKKARWWQFWK